MTKGATVYHPKFGRGKTVDFYEFYNTTFVDVKFENQDKVIYLKEEDLKIEE